MDKDDRVRCFTTCPGGSNVSLMAYKAVSVLTKDGNGKFIRLIGEKAPEKDKQKLAEANEFASEWILIEGCDKSCGKKILDDSGISVQEHLLLTSLGIERENRIDYSPEEFEKVISAIKALLADE